MLKTGSAVCMLGLSFISNANDVALENEMQKLMALEVDITTSMKRAQPLATTPASIFVLSKKEIARSGYTKIPELLKLIPGVDARRIDNNQWAVSVRSAASRFNSNLMVMVDGRNVSEPIINTIYWEALDYPVADIERIELVRGAAGSLWGNSANNGILNIITRHSLDTQGVHAKIGTGDPVRYNAELRYGGTINDTMSYRLFGMASEGKKSGNKLYLDRYFSQANDTHEKHSFGAHLDYQYDAKSALKFQYKRSSSENGILERAVDMTNFGLLYVPKIANIEQDTLNFRIDHSISDGIKLFSQLTYTDFESLTESSGSAYKSSTLNTAVNYRWAGGFLSTGIDIDKSEGSLFTAGGGTNLESTNSGVFLQNESYFFDDSLKILVGSRWDSHKVYGTEVSPNIRFNFSYSKWHSFWGSLSKGTRIMINSDENVSFMIAVPNMGEFGVFEIFRAQTADTIERARTAELGYRYERSDLLITLSLFETKYYSQFIGYESIDMTNGFPIRWLDADNSGTGRTQGADVVVKWEASDKLDAMFGYSILEHQLNGLVENTRPFSPQSFDNYQLFARGQYHFNEQLSGHVLFKHVSDNKAVDSKAYHTVDVALHWQVSQQLKLTLIGQNLADNSFVEFPKEVNLFGSSTAVGRSINVSGTYNF